MAPELQGATESDSRDPGNPAGAYPGDEYACHQQTVGSMSSPVPLEDIPEETQNVSTAEEITPNPDNDSEDEASVASTARELPGAFPTPRANTAPRALLSGMALTLADFQLHTLKPMIEHLSSIMSDNVGRQAGPFQHAADVAEVRRMYDAMVDAAENRYAQGEDALKDFVACILWVEHILTELEVLVRASRPGSEEDGEQLGRFPRTHGRPVVGIGASHAQSKLGDTAFFFVPVIVLALALMIALLW
ncbi:hypothetical protein BV25DRAFT_1835148 [Artomyces pyxidatus]|uniref:Uncharacterized protein n=1 Tax=Artomyces pyxidatus TaxID=48021 RepID=A0ACB8TGE4_9AGAM|nr:hypothetical protein BV25DRAFT_1835148 [Artomyces pyxidatus]